ncbi:DUF3443 family protein [Paraburkholderia sp. BL9I2N2]|uniref:DUF3443 family protein n=1 Tax=Paraburkholderia sp. BL9I2N2 TaxID=1938809 RepID=UPI00104F1CC7|nr:DUF3443 family protein [Paraburkholderia sp. BL9I2N2]TCK84035.1 uncharacterized protein DUF3443 [Paraburkholderia sp. BL9I2N2]
MRSGNTFRRAVSAFGLFVAAVSIAGCGGGGDGDSSSSTSSSSGSSSTSANNQVAVTVARGVEGVANIPTVSITVCAPGSTIDCQTIDNVLVDTMSYGLRLANTAASQVLGNLGVETDRSGSQIAECSLFADGYMWGTVRTADVKVGGETASSVPIAIAGDLSSSAPSSCSDRSVGGALNTVSAIGANGILGIGVTPYDCGTSCVEDASDSTYYSCPNGASCTQTTIALANQVTNPVTKFSTDNNGVVLAMATPASAGSSSVSGTLTFGIGTQSNNTYSASRKLTTNSYGDVNSTMVSGSYSGSAFFDSGSNAYFFTDFSLATCSDSAFYCPSSATTRSVMVSSYSGTSTSATVTMAVANADSLFASGNYAFNDLAGEGVPGTVDIGLPFFYGTSVYFGYDQTPLGGTQKPYVGL